jgi:hypothetical protein
VDFDITSAWQALKDVPLTPAQDASVERLLRFRRGGETSSLPLQRFAPDADEHSRVRQFMASGAPVAILLTNVIWDAAALGRGVAFHSMMDFVHYTIGIFKANPNWKLLIKSHPAEHSPLIPRTRQCVTDAIRSVHAELPPNIMVLPPNSTMTIYDLIPHLRAAMTFTTTASLELAIAGIPVILTGAAPWRNAGFTLDPAAPSDYAACLASTLDGSFQLAGASPQSTLARRYFHLRYLVFQMDLGWLTYSIRDGVTLRLRDWRDLLPGANSTLDHVCHSIINDLPVLSNSRLPPLNRGGS